jgi:hypothetical protein
MQWGAGQGARGALPALSASGWPIPDSRKAVIVGKPIKEAAFLEILLRLIGSGL